MDRWRNEMMEQNEKILEGVQAQISFFDNKASILLSAVGIIFALTLSFIDVFHSEFFLGKDATFRTFYILLFICYILITISLIIFLILVILPRKHNGKEKYPNYYRDINELSKQDLKAAIKRYSEEDDMILEQIKINAEICMKKHKCLKLGVILFIPFIICIVATILMTMFA